MYLGEAAEAIPDESAIQKLIASKVSLVNNPLLATKLPRSPRAVSEAPLYREAVAWQYSEGRFGYSDLKGAARQVGIYVL